MKKRLLKFTLSATLLMGLTVANAQKMDKHIVHGTPWVETRLPYAMTAMELAENYYGNSAEVTQIMKANKAISNASTLLPKEMLVRIPVTSSFTDQPERLGWIH